MHGHKESCKYLNLKSHRILKHGQMCVFVRGKGGGHPICTDARTVMNIYI